MKIRKEIKQSWMIFLIIVMTIAGTSGSVVADVSNIETAVDMTNSKALIGTASTDIKVNGQDGPIIVSSSTPFSITIGLSAGIQIGTNADWWLVVSTPLGWYSWVYPTGWTYGFMTSLQFPLFGFSGLEMFNGSLPVGDYVVYFCVDTTPDDVFNGSVIYDLVAIYVID
jgi:hypothetical protein